MINPLDGLRIAFDALRVNFMRSVLTMLGIVIGVGAVIVMVAIGAGAREMIGAQIRSIGSNLILVVPGATTQGGARLGTGSVHTLKSSDADAIGKECPAVKYAASVWGEVAQVVYGNRNWRTRVTGTYRDYFDIREWAIRHGRFFSNDEEQRGAKVAIVGITVVENLLGEVFPVGKIIRIKNVPFTIIGVLERKGQSPRGDDQDDAIFVPLKTAQYRLFGTPFPDEVSAILVQSKEIEMITEAERQINELIARRHKIGKNQEKDFTVRNLTEILATAQNTLNIMTTLLGAIAAISLLVGGIGIMNIMLVSVTERTERNRNSNGCRRSIFGYSCAVFDGGGCSVTVGRICRYHGWDDRGIHICHFQFVAGSNQPYSGHHSIVFLCGRGCFLWVLSGIQGFQTAAHRSTAVRITVSGTFL